MLRSTGVGVLLAAGLASGCQGSECSDPWRGDWVDTDGGDLYLFCECGQTDSGDTAGAVAAASATCFSSETAPPTCYVNHEFGVVDLSDSPLTLTNIDPANAYSYTLTDDQRMALRETCGAPE